MEEMKWCPIPGFENYEISDRGLIRSNDRIIKFKDRDKSFYLKGRILRPAFDKDCYLKVSLHKDGKSYHYRVHQLVGIAFLNSYFPDAVINHKNEIRWDNRVENLEWVTVADNNRLAINPGRENPLCHKIGKFDKEGVLLATYDAIAHVKRDGYGSRVVNRVVLGQRRTAYGFVWERIEE